ncbi:ribosome-inactivating protein lychnin-like isoform X1 [Silene latifolia]|uniref:ribosome-inactivating protein lychnin-like isoform X1 n=1 Tax=Silene latifolia TaxID=37657 RepID=UPI003D76D410
MKVSSIWAWWLMMAVIVAAASAWPTWTVDYDSEEYSSFLNVLREALGTGTPVCKIPVTTDPPKGRPSSYVLVDLVLNDNTITLALRASDAYLVGYQDTDLKTKKLRANFFSDEYEKLKGKVSTIFGNKDVTLGPKLPVESSYGDLATKAQVSRVDVSLGVPSLETAFTQVYGLDFNDPKKNVGKVVAKFALIAIQMVAEAARFKYIEDQVKERGMFDSFKAGDLITRLENNWSKISEQYHNKDLECKPNVAGFTPDQMKLGLLLYKGGSGLNLNDGHAALAFV